jgi:hypothetical protein
MITLEIENEEKIEMSPAEYQYILDYEQKRPDLFARLPYITMVKMILTNYRLTKHSPIIQLEP